jgi:hypothetical protein
VTIKKLIGTDNNQICLNRDLGKLAFANTALVPAPASATAVGERGQLAADADYLYVCVATNTWERVAIATW